MAGRATVAAVARATTTTHDGEAADATLATAVSAAGGSGDVHEVCVASACPTWFTGLIAVEGSFDGCRISINLKGSPCDHIDGCASGDNEAPHIGEGTGDGVAIGEHEVTATQVTADVVGGER